MTMSEQEKNEFIDAYTKALVSSWSSDEFTSRLERNPREALAEVGLSIPEGARINIVRDIPEDDQPVEGQKGHLDRQLALWETGVATGYYEIYIPQTPQIDLAELDADELADVAAGWTFMCCCCPCSCCT